MPLHGISTDLSKRLAKLETTAFGNLQDFRHLFAVEGPTGLSQQASTAFLRTCGHDVRDDDLVLVFVGAEEGRPVDLPLKDVTCAQSLHDPVVASSLHMQPGQG